MTLADLTPQNTHVCFWVTWLWVILHLFVLTRVGCLHTFLPTQSSITVCLCAPQPRIGMWRQWKIGWMNHESKFLLCSWGLRGARVMSSGYFLVCAWSNQWGWVSALSCWFLLWRSRSHSSSRTLPSWSVPVSHKHKLFCTVYAFFSCHHAFFGHLDRLLVSPWSDCGYTFAMSPRPLLLTG